MGSGWKSAEKGFRIKPLIEYMRQVPDPRCGRKTKHDHAEILICLVMGFLAGRTTIRRILKWCRKHLKWLQEILPLENGIASVPTACRILSGIDEELFALIRKFAYNILRIAMIHEDCSPIMTEAMDDFCDDLSLIKRYVFGGIDSFY